MSWIKAREARKITDEVKHKDEKIKLMKEKIANLISVNCNEGRDFATYSVNEDIEEKYLKAIMSELKDDGYQVTWSAGEEIIGDYGYPVAYRQAHITIKWGG